MEKEYVLALDIGTSSVRSGLYDASGDLVPGTLVKHERTLVATSDGGAEIVAGDAVEQVCLAIDDVLIKSAKIKGNIRYVAASSFWHSLLGIDKNNRPTSMVYGWADTRSRGQISFLRKKLDENETHNRTGARFHSSFWPAKLLWLQNDFSQICARTVKWLSLSDFLMLHFTGTPLTSVSMASATGIFDIRKNEWDAKLLRLLKLKKENLPPIAKTDNQTLRLNAKFAKRWPRLAAAEFFPAIGDGAANNIGAGCVQKNKAALMIGTSGAMRTAFSGEPPETIPDGLWCYRIDRKRIIIGGALSDGGGLYRWLKDHLRIAADDDKTEAEIDKRKPDGHGLTFLPFVAGERSTGYHEAASGAIIGLRTSTDNIDIVQAAFESVGYRFAEIFDRLDSICSLTEVIASGGALRASPIWTQIITDIIGRKMSMPDTREASSRGAVLYALEMAGAIKSIETLATPDGQKFKVRLKNHALYKTGRAIHNQYYGKILS